MKDDGGVIHVFEALLVGVLILTAILFMTALSGPTQSESTGGLDLSRIAADTLDILEARNAEDAQYANRLDELVSEALRGDEAEGQAFLEEVLPSGTRFLLRLDNGVAPITLLPTGGGVANTPRSAAGAEVFYLPNWTAHVADPDPAGEAAAPGEGITFTAGAGLTAPDGSTTAPGGGTWGDWWLAHDATGRTIPPDVPYGLWERGGSFLRVQADQPTDHPVYAVQLLVWPGA